MIEILLSADSDVGLYLVSPKVMECFDELVETFPHPNIYTEKDFVDYIIKKFGSDSIRFIKNVGVYPNIESKYKNLFWFNF